MQRTPSAAAAALATHGGDGGDGGQTVHGLRAHTPLASAPQAPPLFLPLGPFSGFHHLSYMHYLAMEQDRSTPQQSGPMPPVDAYALISE